MSVFSRLRERKVFRLALLYCVAGWGLLQVADIADGLLDLPSWTLRAALLLLVAAFPFALLLAWFFKWTPEGIVREAGPGDEAKTNGTRSVRVLPFRQTDLADGDRRLVAGLHGEISHSLSRVPHIRVAGVSAVLRAPGRRHGRSAEAPADWILVGEISPWGNSLQVSARLVEGAGKREIWTMSRDCTRQELGEVEAAIVSGVARALGESAAAAAQTPAKPVSPEAYLALLNGRHELEKSTAEGCRQAVVLFTDALSLDATLARAWSGSSLAYTWLARYGIVDPEAGFDRAREHAEKALQLDPDLAEAHMAIAQVQLSQAWDFQAAARSLLRALELAPYDGAILDRLGHLLALDGRFDEALALRERSVKLEPLSESAHAGLADTLFLAGQLERAEHALRRLREFAPEFPTRHLQSRIALQSGDPQRALDVIEAEKLEWRRLYIGAIAHHQLGDSATADELLRELTAKYADDAGLQIAIVHAQCGRQDSALSWIERAIQLRDPGCIELKVEPELRPLHDVPRFAALVEATLPGTGNLAIDVQAWVKDDP